MTLLASERSLLIRNKFRSVLQLRIQNRKQNEINADSGLKTTCPPLKGEKDQSEALRLTDDGTTQKSPPSGLNTETAQDRSVCGAHSRQKKARLTEDLSEKTQRRLGSLELPHKHLIPLENRPISFPLSSDVLEDDISSCSSSSSPEQLGVHQSPAFSSSPGLSGDQSLSDMSPVGLPLNHSPTHAQSGLALLSATEGISQPMSMTDSNSMATTGRLKGMYLTSQALPLLPKTARPPSLSPHSSSPLPSSLTSSTRPPRPRKPRDSKPKMRKLKYHQYIPPDQRVGSGTGGGESIQRSPAPAQPIDPAYSRLLQQQQVFLQLQILQNQQQQQQQLTVTPSGDTNQIMRFSGATSQNSQPVPTATHTTPMDTSPSPKPDLLPANLVDLTVSELRQQLRKRGLPVSGTKPALLQRLRPFQLPRTCVTPTPFCQLDTSLDPLTLSPALLLPNQNPSSSPCSGPDSPNNNANQKMYVQPNGVPNGILNGVANSIPNGISISMGGEQCGLSNAVFLAPAGTPSSTPSPGLPPASSSSSSSTSSSSPLQAAGTPWQSEQEQQQQELSLELEMRERMRSRPRERASSSTTAKESRVVSLHPFLQQDPGCTQGKTETDGQTEVLFTQVFSCDLIGQDFELPMQITASPAQAPACSGVRSLEEELQEAIQRVQMDPSQSIEDILDESISCVDSISSVSSDLQSPVTSHPDLSPPPPQAADQFQPFLCHSKDDNFLSSPLCSSVLLELPPSPLTTAPPTASLPPPPPPPLLCASPPLPTVASRKRRALATFDPCFLWLDSLTSGPPLSPLSAPFVETDFCLDSDLNVNRVLDLMVEQW